MARLKSKTRGGGAVCLLGGKVGLLDKLQATGLLPVVILLHVYDQVPQIVSRSIDRGGQCVIITAGEDPTGGTVGSTRKRG